jgi:hypothetical protein
MPGADTIQWAIICQFQASNRTLSDGEGRTGMDWRWTGSEIDESARKFAALGAGESQIGNRASVASARFVPSVLVVVAKRSRRRG